MSEFSPHLNVLPEGQRRLWGELSAVPREFTLYGGTALASGTKASVLQVRAEAKDYIDMDALIQIGKVGLPFALAAAEKLYGSSFNPEITLKALSYFDDGNLRKLPTDMKFRLADAVRKVDLNHLPSLGDFKLRNDRDRGLGL